MNSIIKIILGNMLITGAYAFITVPNGIVNGGITSFSMILSSVTGVDISIYTNCITILLLILCLIFLGKNYFAKSIVSSVCYMLFFSIFNGLNIEFIQLPILVDVLLASVLVGIGYYFCLSAKSSTVGFDVIALILHSKNENIQISKVMRYINFIVILFGLFSYGIYSVLFGILFTYIQTAVIHLLLEQSNLKVNVYQFIKRFREVF